MAAADPGPLLLVLAGEDPLGAGAASGSADHRTADQQVGGALEGIWLLWRLILESPSFISGSRATKFLLLVQMKALVIYRDGSVTLAIIIINHNKHKDVESTIVIGSILALH